MVIRKRLKINGPALAFITTTITNWYPIFNDEVFAEIALKQLDETSAFHSLSVIGYVLMPSHIHILLGFPEIEKLSKIIQSYKSLTSRKIKPKLSSNIIDNFTVKNKYLLWKTRFDDLIVFSEIQLKVKLDYIHNNPVKAGFVQEANQYKYSSAADWLDKGQGLVKIDKDYKWLLRE